MAARYWVGGTGNWDASDTTHWSATSNGAGGASVPGASDDVTLDASSGGGTVTVTATVLVNGLKLNTYTGIFDTNDSTITVTNAIETPTQASGGSLYFGNSTVTFGYIIVYYATAFHAETSTAIHTCLGSVVSSDGTAIFYNFTSNMIASGNNVFSGSLSFTNLIINGYARKTCQLSLSGNITVSGILTISNGVTPTNRVLICSSAPGTARTITVTGAEIVLTYVDFADITMTDSGVSEVSSCGDCGGNTGQVFDDIAELDTAETHWINVNGGNWSDAANWSVRVPLPQDNVYMDCAFGTSKTVTADMPRLGRNIDWTGATWTTALTFNSSVDSTFYGSLIYISGLLSTGNFSIAAAGRSSYDINTYTTSLGQFLRFTGSVGGVYTLQSDFTSTNANPIVLEDGTFNLNGHNITSVGGFSSGANNRARTLNLGSGTWTISTDAASSPWNTTASCTVVCGTSTIKITGGGTLAKNFVGGGKTYYKLWFDRGVNTYANSVYGSNTFYELKDTGTEAHNIVFENNKTNTFTVFSVSGSAGKLITLKNSSSTTHSTLAKAGGGTISGVNYVALVELTGSPALTWYMGPNSTDTGSTCTNMYLSGVPVILVVANASHSHTAEAVVITQKRILGVSSAIHAHEAENVLLSADNLSINNSAHAPTSDNITLSQKHILTIEDLAHSLTSDEVSVVGASDLVVTGSTHTLVSESPVLIEAKTLAVADTSHAHEVESVDLIEHDILEVQDASHASSGDEDLAIVYTIIIHSRRKPVGGVIKPQISARVYSQKPTISISKRL